MSDRGRFSILKQSDFVSIMEDETREITASLTGLTMKDARVRGGQ